MQIVTGQEFEVNRRIYVDFEGISLRRKFLTGLEPELINVMIGKLISFSWSDVSQAFSSTGSQVINTLYLSCHRLSAD